MGSRVRSSILQSAIRAVARAPSGQVGAAPRLSPHPGETLSSSGASSRSTSRAGGASARFGRSVHAGRCAARKSTVNLPGIGHGGLTEESQSNHSMVCLPKPQSVDGSRGQPQGKGDGSSGRRGESVRMVRLGTWSLGADIPGGNSSMQIVTDSRSRPRRRTRAGNRSTAARKVAFAPQAARRYA